MHGLCHDDGARPVCAQSVWEAWCKIMRAIWKSLCLNDLRLRRSKACLTKTTAPYQSRFYKVGEGSRKSGGVAPRQRLQQGGAMGGRCCFCLVVQLYASEQAGARLATICKAYHGTARISKAFLGRGPSNLHARRTQLWHRAVI